MPDAAAAAATISCCCVGGAELGGGGVGALAVATGWLVVVDVEILLFLAATAAVVLRP